MTFKRVRHSANYYRAKIFHSVLFRSHLTPRQMVEEAEIECRGADVGRHIRRLELNKEPISMELFNRVLHVATRYALEIDLVDLRLASEFSPRDSTEGARQVANQ